ncbi:MAG: hypothetical protein AB2A00_15495 [Myxococcota bacterium]
MILRLAALALVVVVLSARPAFPCSAFMRTTPEGPVVAKSYDWSQERGLVLINKRGVNKRALVMSVPVASWTSRYASLTFNQYGREFPNGGLNEEGLVVEVLLLPSSEYPSYDLRPAISELGLVQYLLDQASTLYEAVTLANEVRVSPVYAKLHYFVCDGTGACATLEFLSGRLVATRGRDLPVPAVTNSTYADSKRSLTARKRPKPRSSLGRFNVISQGLKRTALPDPVGQAWSLLDEVRFEDSTQWQVVYEVGPRRVHFRTRTHPNVKTVSLSAFERDCDAPVMMHDLLSDARGDITARFAPYDEKRNLALVTATLKPMKKSLPPGIVSVVGAYPGTLSCAK